MIIKEQNLKVTSDLLIILPDGIEIFFNHLDQKKGPKLSKYVG